MHYRLPPSTPREWNVIERLKGPRSAPARGLLYYSSSSHSPSPLRVGAFCGRGRDVASCQPRRSLSVDPPWDTYFWRSGLRLLASPIGSPHPPATEVPTGSSGPGPWREAGPAGG